MRSFIEKYIVVIIANRLYREQKSPATVCHRYIYHFSYTRCCDTSDTTQDR
ncbi:MAG: hypothetical protein P8Y35_00760 [Sulfurovaceae bacterium]